MPSVVNIAVDCMSGDHGPHNNLHAVVNILKKGLNLHIHLCGDESVIQEIIPDKFKPFITIHPTKYILPSDIPPSSALRIKHMTSLHQALNLVADKKAQVIVSSANTGAYMALSLKKIGLLPGIQRPAIAKFLPSFYPDSVIKESLVLDLGANINCPSKLLINFAHMAKEYIFKTKHIAMPSIGILNIGSEAGKGTEALQETFEALSTMEGIRFIGFVEGDQLLKGIADIIVCDGFHGNIALKTLEGTAKGLYHALQLTIQHSSIWGKLGALLLKNPLKRTFGGRYNPKRYNGALFLGLNQNVIKSHGSADEESFTHALMSAYETVNSSA